MNPSERLSWILAFGGGAVAALGLAWLTLPDLLSPPERATRSSGLESVDGRRRPEALPALPGSAWTVPTGTVPPGSPYSLYPLSFPKLLAGLLFFEQQVPTLSATAAQCQRFLPLFEGLGTVWAEANATGLALHPHLTPAQQQRIAEHKRQLEQSSGHAHAQEVLQKRYGIGLFPQGLGVYGPVALLSTYRSVEAAPVSRPGSGAETVGSSGPPAPGRPLDAESGAGVDGSGPQLTASDIAAGLITLEEEPALRMTPAQARALRPLFERLVALNAQVEYYFTGIQQGVTRAQLEGIGAHIAAITEFKLGLWKNAGPQDRDPLIHAAIALCQGKHP